MLLMKETIVILRNPNSEQNGYQWRQPVIVDGMKQYIDIKKISLEEYNKDNEVVCSISIDVNILPEIKKGMSKLIPRSHHKEKKLEKRLVSVRPVK